jgi:hypothetical protein
MFWKTKADLNLETKTTKVATERNKKKVDKMFDSMVCKINNQREKVKKELVDATAARCVHLSGREFFMDLYQRLKDVFAHVIDGIRAEWKIVKDAVKRFFD